MVEPCFKSADPGPACGGCFSIITPPCGNRRTIAGILDTKILIGGPPSTAADTFGLPVPPLFIRMVNPRKPVPNVPGRRIILYEILTCMQVTTSSCWKNNTLVTWHIEKIVSRGRHRATRAFSPLKRIKVQMASRRFCAIV